jgi:hypothetical protein
LIVAAFSRESRGLMHACKPILIPTRPIENEAARVWRSQQPLLSGQLDWPTGSTRLVGHFQRHPQINPAALANTLIFTPSRRPGARFGVKHPPARQPRRVQKT